MSLPDIENQRWINVGTIESVLVGGSSKKNSKILNEVRRSDVVSNFGTTSHLRHRTTLRIFGTTSVLSRRQSSPKPTYVKNSSMSPTL